MCERDLIQIDRICWKRYQQKKNQRTTSERLAIDSTFLRIIFMECLRLNGFTVANWNRDEFACFSAWAFRLGGRWIEWSQSWCWFSEMAEKNQFRQTITFSNMWQKYALLFITVYDQRIPWMSSLLLLTCDWSGALTILWNAFFSGENQQLSLRHSYSAISLEPVTVFNS